MSADGISAVVLAGTHHWSGSSFERLAPRPLVPVALTPLISYTLRWLRSGGVRRAAICANGTSALLEAIFGDGAELGMELHYCRDDTPRGPAGCVRDAAPRAGSETLVVTGATALPTVDLADLLGAHRASGAAATAAVHRGRQPFAPPTPGGVYVFERRALAHVPESGFQDIKESLIPKLHRAGEGVAAYQSGGSGLSVVNAQTYLAVNQWMVERLAQEDGATLVHPSAQVERGARLVGPVQLGAGARVEAGATIVGPTSIGPGSTVGRGALVARSVVWSRCAVGEGSVVHGCVLGNEAVVPSGSRLFNAVRPQPLSPAGAPGASARGREKTARLRAPGPAFHRPLSGSIPTSCPIG
jgi:NDP-sugar pyrophosphorylase family protein